ncbi:MAG TPA: AMP-binding protein [Candidatus Thiothrix moscowensis]|uniref:AMP-binding protein n=1 Tax=unclassified Thiothrix TaxID=2636184 RepID=UPI00260109C5|nr:MULTISPECIES: AMP-binding protein [unclassified Thiothrix]HRJ53443.1 AMP-binding protein [Candidatus Thiothrix moscowensis]HRJ93522.1 AMP-binding protein [Candidatus Thiothrix moscowensis]
MDKLWLQSYPPSVPAEIDLSQYRSLADLFHHSVAKYRALPAYSNLGKVLTYAEVDELTRQFAAYLTHGAGLQRGDRIAIMMPNLLQYPIALFAALRAGLVVVNTNPLYTDRELEHQLKDSGAKAIVILANFAHTLEKVMDEVGIKTIITTEIGDLLGFPKSLLVNAVVKYVKKMVPAYQLPEAIGFNQALRLGKQYAQRYQDADLNHADTAFLQYTGGTTGVAKGAVLTHRNLLANMLQADAWTKGYLQHGKEIFITALPLYHVFALTANALFAMEMGAKNVLITNPRDLPAFIKDLCKEPFTFMTGVNTLYNALLNHAEIGKVDFSHLKIGLGGGMAVQKSVAERWKALTGSVLLEAYGLTETSPAVCINPVTLQDYNGMIGLPIPSTEVSIRDVNDRELGVGEAGELWVRGPQVMQGYWQRPDETAKVMPGDGWLRTGDVAIINAQGYVKLVDRLKDMVLVSGFNVYPNEVEDVLAANPKILEAGVIGVPDEHSGEIVKAFIVKKDGSLTVDEVKTYCRAELSAYKCPKQVVFVDSLPKSNVGKILRKELRQFGNG